MTAQSVLRVGNSPDETSGRLQEGCRRSLTTNSPPSERNRGAAETIGFAEPLWLFFRAGAGLGVWNILGTFFPSIQQLVPYFSPPIT